MSADPKGVEQTRRVPTTLVILGSIILLSAVATLVLPRGEYDRETKVFSKLESYTLREGDDLASIARELKLEGELAPGDVLSAQDRQPLASLVPGTRVLVATPGLERTAIVPGTFRSVEAAPDEGFADRLGSALESVSLAPVQGFVARAEVIAFVLMIGGAFGIILATGAIDLALIRAVGLLGEGWLRNLVVPLSMALFSFGGAAFGMGESTIAFVLVTIPLSIRLGYDTVTGICMCYLASQIGFAGAFFNPFTVGIGQSIAELPYLSGLGFRVVTWFTVTGVGIAMVTWWAGRVRANPALSPTAELDARWRERLTGEEADSSRPLGLGTWLVVIVALGTIVLSGVGVVVWDIYNNPGGC